MADFTLLELHLEDAEISSNAPFLASDRGEAEPSETSSGGKGKLLGVVGLVVLVVAGVLAVKKFRGGSGSRTPVEKKA